MSKIKAFFEKAIAYILKYQKFSYPIIALVLAAVVVVVVLNLQKSFDNSGEQPPVTNIDPNGLGAVGDENVPLETSTDEMLNQFLNDYFECLSTGDGEKLASMCDMMDDSDILRYEEQSKYLNYTINEIYTQDGPVEGSFVAYVYNYVVFNEYPDLNFPAYKGFYIKTSEDGYLYIVNGEITDEENAYISDVVNQEDVIELNNKFTVENKEVVIENPFILDYLVQLDTIVSTAVGERLAELNASQGITDGDENGNGQGDIADIPLENQTLYATALTSVNVRKSASAESDRLGEVSQGQKLEVVEVLQNGWTKVIYEGEEAYIKSEYLSLIQSADSAPTIGMMKALDNVNVRSEANTESSVLGALVTGDSYEIAAVENGWVMIKFDGILAYVSAEYCDCTIFE